MNFWVMPPNTEYNVDPIWGSMFKHCQHCGMDYFLFHNCEVHKKEALVDTPQELGFSVLKEAQPISALKETQPVNVPKLPEKINTEEAVKKFNPRHATSSVFVPNMIVSSSMCIDPYINIYRDKFLDQYYTATERKIYERELERRKLREKNFPNIDEYFTNSDGF